MTFEIRVTRNDGTQEFTEIETCDGMAVATHIIVDIRSLAYHVYDPTIKEVRYHAKGTKGYRYA